MNINILSFAHSTYTFSWTIQKTPSQLVTELSKKNNVINVDKCRPVLRRTKPIPIPIKIEEVIDDSSITVHHRTNQTINSTNVLLYVCNSKEQSSEELDDSFGFFDFFE